MYSVYEMIEWLYYEHIMVLLIYNIHIFWFDVKSYCDARYTFENEKRRMNFNIEQCIIISLRKSPSVIRIFLCENKYKAYHNTHTFPMESTLWKSLMWAQKLKICTKRGFKAMDLSRTMFSRSFHMNTLAITKHDVLREFHVAAPIMKLLYCCISVFGTLTTLLRLEWEKHPDVYCFSCFHFCWGAFAFLFYTLVPSPIQIKCFVTLRQCNLCVFLWFIARCETTYSRQFKYAVWSASKLHNIVVQVEFHREY